MKARTKWGWAVLASTSALFGVLGCHEPKDIVPVAPPGLEMQRIPAVAQGEPQAIGETAIYEPKQKGAAPISDATSPPTPLGQSVKSASGLEYVTLKEGDGASVKSGQTVVMHYVGTLTDGTKFDSSRDKNSPFKTVIGVGQVIRGWDEGVPGMKVGERRKLTIPSDLGYGPNGSPPKIPGGATLLFDVELLNIL